MSLSAEIATFTNFVRKCSRQRTTIPPNVEVIPTGTGAILSAQLLEAVIQYRVDTTEPFTGLNIASHVPQEPLTWSSLSTEFLNAMHEAGRFTGDNRGTQYTLHRIQLLGSAGRIAAGDGECAVIYRGFRFPFDSDLFIPALPLFGSAEFRKLDGPVQVGHTDQHFVVKIEPWTVFLRIDPAGQFPNLAKLVPKSSQAAELTLAEPDAESLQQFLKVLECELVTFELSETITARGDGDQSLPLTQSQVTLGPLTLAVNRKHCERALKLGCRTLRAIGHNQALSLSNKTVTVLTICHESPHTPRTTEMKPSSPTKPIPTSASDTEEIDPLIEAEALRTALGVAHQRLSRLLVALKSIKKDKKTFTQVLTSLQSLKLR